MLTYDVESVAQATGKPLFAVSVSDIGLKPDQVESKLAQVFSLASKWEAILLLYVLALLVALVLWPRNAYASYTTVMKQTCFLNLAEPTKGI